ncbi:MlaC/ttg2D family ABC transporter substrate-binding protein [Denitromonas halophila]|uniref:ABC transporter substrate-binding protein n=1 Tax=Denitromonas halophila TaxID=1629404 RepID=A0A557R0U1_9RHOO|nr:ABC transporter substrate-binding protein [Denitromonas halophila]TVO58770.1 ABC transporter substrate-binding protein [Denitromonas halophila]
MLRSLFASLLLLVALAATAQTDTPDTLVRNVTDEVLGILSEAPESQADRRQTAMRLIENKIAPHFDFTRMTALAVGQGWRQADEGQRDALTEEFRTLLVRTYANALGGYSGQKVHFKPSRAAGAQDEATVRSEIRQAGAPPITMDYQLARTDGDWKVFDVVVNNVSLVTNYRSSFATELAQGGADGLIRALRDKNRQAADSG